MNLTWHIVKKDLCALKWPIAIWLACIVTKLGVGVLLLSSDGQEGPAWFSQMDTLSKGLAVGELLSFVLVAALIQEDLMVGTSAFWMTRPISGARLLRAKLLSIGAVFLVAPVLLTLPWWLGCNYGLDEIAWAAAETFAVHALVVLAALVWSAVTDNLGRFVLWSLVTLVATPMLTATLGYYVRRSGAVQVPEIMSTRLLVAGAVMFVGIALILIHQYLTRRTWRSIAILGSSLGLAVLVLGVWPWAWNAETRISTYLIRRAQGNWPAETKPAGLKFELGSLEFSAPRANRPGTLLARYRVEGLGESQGVIAYPSEQRWTWPDGTTEKGVIVGRSILNNVALNRARAFAKGEAGPVVDTEGVTMTSLVRTDTLAKIRAQAPASTLSARFRLMKYQSTTILPIQSTGWQSEGVVSQRIAEVEKVGDQQHITFVQHAPSLWVDIVGGGRLAPAGGFSRYFLVNRKLGWVDGGHDLATRSTRIGTVEIVWRTLFFQATPKAGAKATLESIRALDDAELIKVTFSEQTRFSEELQIDAARIAQANP